MSDNHDPTRLEQKQARLTAYALRQLDASELAAVEAELAASPEAREFVEEIRALADHVHEAARHEPLPPPSPALRDKLCARLNELEDRPMTSDDIRPSISEKTDSEKADSPRRRWVPWVAAACVLLLATGALALVVPDWLTGNRGPRDVALRDEGYSGSDGKASGSSPDAAEPAEQPAKLDWLGPGAPGGGDGEGLDGLGAEPTYNASPSTDDMDSPVLDSGGISLEHRSVSDGGSGPGDGGGKRQYGGDRTTPGRVAPTYTPSVQPVPPKPPSQPIAESPTKEAQPKDELQLARRDERGHYFDVDKVTGVRRPRPQPLPESEPAEAPAAEGDSPDDAFHDPLGSTAPADAPADPFGGGAPAEEPADAPGADLADLFGAPAPEPHPTPRGGQGRGQSQGQGQGGALVTGPAPTGQDPSSATPSPVELARVERSKNNKWYDGREPPRVPDPTPGTEDYDKIYENPFHMVGDKPLSTFSIDVDTASYANVRRFLREGRLPPPDAVRIEEMVNYFKYRYPQPKDETPFSAHMEVTECPWRTDNRLLKVGLKGREIDREQRGLSNLVFLLDVSGSMSSQEKLPLVKKAMRLLVEQLSEDDRVAIVTYASNAGLQLESTCGEYQEDILKAIDGLSAGGSTHGSAGIQMAYEQAAKHFIQKGVNRVILCTDGDLNVGITRDDDLVQFIEDKAKTGVFLTVLGFGTGNLKDSKMEKLADKGNGTYAYIDNLREARKVLVEQMTGSLITIAKDVKIQIEFNPAEVMAYRLIGYENRVMAAEDFDDDRKDAGEIGAGHTVTALYELVPTGAEYPAAGDRSLKYQQVPEKNLTDAAKTGELLTLRLRYKQPDGEQSQLLEFSVQDEELRFGQSSPDFQFAASVAAFGMLLRGSKYAGDATLAAVEEYAVSGLGDDSQGYRAEFVDLIRRARNLSPR